MKYIVFNAFKEFGYGFNEAKRSGDLQAILNHVAESKELELVVILSKGFSANGQGYYTVVVADLGDDEEPTEVAPVFMLGEEEDEE